MKYESREGTTVKSLDEPDVITYTWSAFPSGANTAPDTDTEIDVSQDETIQLQADTTPTANVSNDVDMKVYGSPDGSVWDTEHFAGMNLGDNQLKSMLILSGFKKIRLRSRNNHASDNAAPRAKIYRRT